MIKKMKIMKKVSRNVGVFVLLLLLSCNLFLLAEKKFMGNMQPEILGFSAAVVVSGSMEPSISVDDMIVIRRQDAYEVGDVITFTADGSLVTHRVQDMTSTGFLTQGDANDVPDLERVSAEQIVGKVVIVIPKVGAVVGFLKTPMGMTVMAMGMVLLLAASTFRQAPQKEREEGGGA